ncbi:diaminopimelate decarboxylase family protein [Actinopolyspora alba]|uniref:diaminopimelate decarboxylase family protein n=1 Tax=Actinopolyspora alba TaxID=673379 RepID=UPI00158770A7|nr:hypothetical protein [Actinopolyspora alba]
MYLFSPEQLRRHVRAYSGLVGSTSRITYPIKANPTLPVLRCLVEMGVGVDCATPQELALARAAGFEETATFYNSPALDMPVATDLVRRGGTVVVNSPEQLRHLADHVHRAEASSVFVRWNPGLHPVGSGGSIQAHGTRHSQFGMDSETVLETLAESKVPIRGIHTHVGSQTHDLAVFDDALEGLHQLVDRIHDCTRQRITTLNLGGGLAGPSTDRGGGPDIADLVRTLRSRLRADLSYHVEPGNSLVGACMGLLTRVVAVDDNGTHRWGIIDVGSNQLLRSTILHSPHPVMDRNHRLLSTDGRDALAGPLCFAGDLVLPRTSLESVRPGDPLFVQHCGAYCQALGNHFNGYLAPATVALGEDGEFVMVSTSEPPWLDPARTTYVWSNDQPHYDTPRSFRPTESTVDHREWHLHHARQISANTFSYELDLPENPVRTITFYDIITELVRISLARLRPGSPNEAGLHHLVTRHHTSQPTDGEHVTSHVGLGPTNDGLIPFHLTIGDLVTAHGTATTSTS